jgi:hypothetical protein
VGGPKELGDALPQSFVPMHVIRTDERVAPGEDDGPGEIAGTVQHPRSSRGPSDDRDPLVPGTAEVRYPGGNSHSDGQATVAKDGYPDGGRRFAEKGLVREDVLLTGDVRRHRDRGSIAPVPREAALVQLRSPPRSREVDL